MCKLPDCHMNELTVSHTRQKALACVHRSTLHSRSTPDPSNLSRSTPDPLQILSRSLPDPLQIHSRSSTPDPLQSLQILSRSSPDPLQLLSKSTPLQILSRSSPDPLQILFQILSRSSPDPSPDPLQILSRSISRSLQILQILSRSLQILSRSTPILSKILSRYPDPLQIQLQIQIRSRIRSSPLQNPLSLSRSSQIPPDLQIRSRSTAFTAFAPLCSSSLTFLSRDLA
ncbi:hypothetical protein WMY93_018240 [Mugilogobius chulae]|uniref:Uncharacterized protein n=1 Tax=Mugilogobius chulae TaxID=88201 RepID=A0AAW0NV24_9GOBI